MYFRISSIFTYDVPDVVVHYPIVFLTTCSFSLILFVYTNTNFNLINKKNIFFSTKSLLSI
jgi:hypothetical protein